MPLVPDEEHTLTERFFRITLSMAPKKDGKKDDKKAAADPAE